jgi:hypothetical protein
MEQNMNWQLIETAPKDGTFVLVAWTHAKRYDVAAAKWCFKDPDSDGWHDEDGGAWFDDDDEECNPPTHWMPLPEPPQSV